MAEDRSKSILTLMMVLLFVLWAVTNISSTVMSVSDGRSISLGLAGKGEEYIERNVPPPMIDVLPQLKNYQVPLFGEWLVSSFYGDALNYMSMAMGYDSYEPYSLRPLYPKVVGFISELRLFLGESNTFRVYSSTFYLTNMLFFFLSVVLGFRLLMGFVNNPALAMVISIFSFLQLGYLKTLYSPMVDQPAVFMAILFVYLFSKGRLVSLSIAAFFAILTKDSLVIFGILPGLALIFRRDSRMILPCVSVLATFVLLRVVSGSDPLSVQYGWEVSKGDIRFDYLFNHFGSMRGILNWLTGIWFSFGPSIVLCSILLFTKQVVPKDRFLLFALGLASIFFVFAQVMLASRIARTLTPASILMVMVTLSMAFKYYHHEIDHAFRMLLGKKNGVEG